MTVVHLTEAQVQDAKRIWADYQRHHDVSQLSGHAVGIDVVTRRVWFGEKAVDIARQMRAEGIERPFFCVRVGLDHYGHKGRRGDDNRARFDEELGRYPLFMTYRSHGSRPREDSLL